MNIRKSVRILAENIVNNKGIICYHRSDEYEHMVNNEFTLEEADDEYSIFGKAVYFASSSDMSSQLGKYLCKFKISLDNPLNLNLEISNNEANNLLETFNKMYGTKISYYNKELGESVDYYDFNDEFNNVQYGEFFLELQDILNNEPNKYFQNFIKNYLGYNSFYHYSDYGTNFITKEGDYGFCYGVYNTNDIEFIDGPF